MKIKQRGFTLIELMIIIVMLAILATIAYPSYAHYIRQTRLANVRTQLLHNAKQMERHYTQHNTFVNFNASSLEQNDYFTIAFRPSNNTSNPNPSASDFILQAVPKSDANPDEPCTIYLNGSGIFWASSSDTSKTCLGYEEPAS